MFTSRRRSGEIDWHTFDGVVLGHINDSARVAVPKSAMPSLYVGNARGIQARVGELGRIRDDVGGKRGDRVQVPGIGYCSPRNGSTGLFVDYPANIFIKAADGFTITIECADGNEPD